MAWYEVVLILVVGLLTGGINTLAGSGSLITLPLLIFLGLPADVANGTNRIGVLLQTAVAVPTMQRRKPANLKGAWWIFLIGTIGAVIGARLAVELNEDMMEMAIGSLMIIMLLVILVKPNRWLKDGMPNPDVIKKPQYWLLFFILGIYGGFIQAGIGIFLLAGLVLGLGYNIVHANIIKLLFVFIYTIPVMWVFIANDLVNWKYGLLLSVGQIIGAWLSARFATGHPDAKIWIRKLLIIVVVASIIKFFYPLLT
jgi:uncharacterized membrane protein YfcA